MVREPTSQSRVSSTRSLAARSHSVLGVGLDDLKVEVVDDALNDVAGGDLGVADLGLVAEQLPGEVPALPRRLRHAATVGARFTHLFVTLVALGVNSIAF